MTLSGCALMMFTSAAIVLGACSSDAIPKGTVHMTEGRVFEPGTITIAPGETVTFVNRSSEGHTVTARADGIPSEDEYFASGGSTSEEDARADVSSGLLSEGDGYEVTLDEPGTYEYFCIPHEAHPMAGTIVVKG